MNLFKPLGAVFRILAAVIGVPGLFSESLTSTIIDSLATLLFAAGFLGAGYRLLTINTGETDSGGKPVETVTYGE